MQSVRDNCLHSSQGWATMQLVQRRDGGQSCILSPAEQQCTWKPVYLLMMKWFKYTGFIIPLLFMDFLPDEYIFNYSNRFQECSRRHFRKKCLCFQGEPANVSYTQWKGNCGTYGSCLTDKAARFCPVICPVWNWDITNNNGCDFQSKQSTTLTEEARCKAALKPLFRPREFTGTAWRVISHVST